jgi:hypothetical protein
MSSEIWIDSDWLMPSNEGFYAANKWKCHHALRTQQTRVQGLLEGGFETPSRHISSSIQLTSPWAHLFSIDDFSLAALHGHVFLGDRPEMGLLHAWQLFPGVQRYW